MSFLLQAPVRVPLAVASGVGLAAVLCVHAATFSQGAFRALVGAAPRGGELFVDGTWFVALFVAFAFPLTLLAGLGAKAEGAASPEDAMKLRPRWVSRASTGLLGWAVVMFVLGSAERRPRVERRGGRYVLLDRGVAREAPEGEALDHARAGLRAVSAFGAALLVMPLACFAFPPRKTDEE